MSARWKMWWGERSPREQRMLGVMFALMALVAIWLAVIAMLNAQSNARLRYETALGDHARLAEQADALAAFRKAKPAALGMPLGDFVSRSASETGFVPGPSQPSGADQANITIASARPIALFQWVASLERHGIVPQRLVARANSDRTLNVQVDFRSRAR